MKRDLVSPLLWMTMMKLVKVIICFRPSRKVRKRAYIRNRYNQAPHPQGGGGTLIFSRIRRLGLLFWVQNFEFQYFLGFQKNKYFLGV